MVKSADSPGSAAPRDDALRSVHTSNLPGLFQRLGISLVVSTYQAGKVIVVRADGNALNTHFRTFNKPMGISADRNRITIGGANTVWYYRNMPAVAQKLEPPDKHDACYLPRQIHVTGDIDIHELAWDSDNELWVVNTRFCCLCTLDADNSFNPRWRPPFVSALAPQDRCHLNGLGMVDGKPKYVTALGETDTEGGWRVNKRDGGILMDIDTNEVLLRGLSMPHSPRWYQDTLWVLESGEGSLAVVDLDERRLETVAQVPGFTRGIDFFGDLAFIGLSQVRESAVFSGIPLVERVKDRTCGVWVVRITTGQILGFLRFEAGVQEIFAVQVLQGVNFPEILEWNDPRLSQSYMLPDDAMSQVAMPTEEEVKDSPRFNFQHGTALHRKGKVDEAVRAFRECLARDPAFPNARYNLGVALGDAGQLDEAIEHLERVVELEPERADAFNSLGFVASRQRNPHKAISYYEKAIELQPKHAWAHFNLGMTLLQIGDYRRGFEEYEWRWRTGEFTPFRCPHPQWNGEPIPEKTLLVYTEQGAGDAIQLARYLPLAAQRCKKLILVCVENLEPLFSTIHGITEIRPAGSFGVSEFDTYTPLMSLPRLFETTRDTIPAYIPYFHMAVLRRRRPGAGAILPGLRPKIGIVWAGSPTHKNDRNRSCRIRDFGRLLKLAGIDFYSLQKGPQTDELATLPSGIELVDLGTKFRDFGDTAVALDQLDLVISVDTAVAHLAGALGKRVWTLLPYVPDWRWGLDSDSTPWYPCMRLFRQTRRGDWGDVIERAANELAEELEL
jgi:uncharacterized protein (TIGR03032 family)